MNADIDTSSLPSSPSLLRNGAVVFFLLAAAGLVFLLDQFRAVRNHVLLALFTPTDNSILSAAFTTSGTFGQGGLLPVHASLDKFRNRECPLSMVRTVVSDGTIVGLSFLPSIVLTLLTGAGSLAPLLCNY
jgi:hypothetical protein